MKIHNVIVLLAAMLSSTTSFADTPAPEATQRATFASLRLYLVGATIVRLEKERRVKFTFNEVRTIVTGAELANRTEQNRKNLLHSRQAR
jgi:hypothetical protein